MKALLMVSALLGQSWQYETSSPNDYAFYSNFF
jgi:hypothetical protein